MPWATHTRITVEVDRQAWVVVYLEHPWLQFRIDKHVEAEHFERLTTKLTLVRDPGDLMLHHRTVETHDFTTGISNTTLQAFNIDISHLADRGIQGCECTLRSSIVKENLLVARILIVRISFIDAVVGQMHVDLSIVILSWCLVESLETKKCQN